MEASFDHGQLVVSGSGIAAYLDISSEQGRGFLKFLVGDAQRCQLQQRVGEIGIRAQGRLEELFGGRLISLPSFDVTHVEQAGSVVRVELKPLLEIFFGFIESPQMAVGETHKDIGARRRFELDQRFKFLDRLFGFSRHEVALAQRGMEIGPLGARFSCRTPAAGSHPRNNSATC